MCTSEVCLPRGHRLEKTQLVGVPRAEAVEANTMITVEYYRPGSENPGDVVLSYHCEIEEGGEVDDDGQARVRCEPCMLI